MKGLLASGAMLLICAATSVVAWAVMLTPAAASPEFYDAPLSKVQSHDLGGLLFAVAILVCCLFINASSSNGRGL